jgi:hypothetical protein
VTIVRRLLLLALFACHRPAPPAQAHRDAAADARISDAAPIDAAPVDAPLDARTIDAGPRPAREGEVCKKGRGSLAPERPCEHGLHCCYPCGIQGCDFVCKPVCISAP